MIATDAPATAHVMAYDPESRTITLAAEDEAAAPRAPKRRKRR